uniref:Uncharacterized protein n=1 Tax=Pinguiococcus pyrenoidosus TaxID=172671 RepID=A0A7R9U8F7_9STRA
MYFCTAEDLLRFEMASRFCKTITEVAWRRLVRKRWLLNVDRMAPRVFGGATWKRAYKALCGRQRMPRGRHSQKHNLAFAHGLHDGVETWTTLHHREDCRLPQRLSAARGEREADGSRSAVHEAADGARFFEIRVVVQNLRNASVEVLAGCAGLQLITEHGLKATLRQVGANLDSLKALHPAMCALPEHVGAEADASLGEPFHAFPQLVAYNGRALEELSSCYRGAFSYKIGPGETERIPAVDEVDHSTTGTPVSARRVRLINPMHFAVIGMAFAVPASFVYETDVLVRAYSLHIPAIITDALTGKQRAVTLSCRFKGEEHLWKHYKYLPGGFLVLETGSSLARV